MEKNTVRLTDERYTNEPQEFIDYDAMIDEIREMCNVNGWEPFTDEDEDDLEYDWIDEEK